MILTITAALATPSSKPRRKAPEHPFLGAVDRKRKRAVNFQPMHSDDVTEDEENTGKSHSSSIGLQPNPS